MKDVPRDKDILFTVCDEDTGEVFTGVGKVDEYFLMKRRHVFIGVTSYPFDAESLKAWTELPEPFTPNGCSKFFAFWLDEEYEEPEVDWENVPVDTLVRVRDGEYEKWRLRYFSGFFEYDSLKYATWNSGRTSKTADGTDDFTTWRYCELVEDEDGNSSI